MANVSIKIELANKELYSLLCVVLK